MPLRSTAVAAAILLGAAASLSACAEKDPGPVLSEVNKPTTPAPTSALPGTSRSFTGGPGVGASLNSGIGPGPAFNNRLVR